MPSQLCLINAGCWHVRTQGEVVQEMMRGCHSTRAQLEPHIMGLMEDERRSHELELALQLNNSLGVRDKHPRSGWNVPVWPLSCAH